MGQANRGTKRHCGQCGAKFYDLGRVPVVCPKCHADYVAEPGVPGLAGAHPNTHSEVRPVGWRRHAAEPDDGDAFAVDDMDGDTILPTAR